MLLARPFQFWNSWYGLKYWHDRLRRWRHPWRGYIKKEGEQNRGWYNYRVLADLEVQSQGAIDIINQIEYVPVNTASLTGMKQYPAMMDLKANTEEYSQYDISSSGEMNQRHRG